MAVLYSNNFEAESNGALPGWTTQDGSGLAVSNLNSAQGTPVQGTKHYGNGSEGDAARWEAGGVLTNQAVRIAQKWAASGSSIAAFLRIQTTLADRGVLMLAQASGGNLRGNIIVRDGGTISSFQSAYNVPVVAGDLLHLEASAVGNVFELRLWTNSNPRPATATASHTSTFWPSGRAGLRKTGATFEFAACDNLVITDAAGGEEFFYGTDTTAPTLTSPTGTQTGGTSASGTVSTNEGNGTLFRLASTSASVSAATVKAANITSAVTATGVQNVSFTGLTASTTYFAHYVHTDAAGNDSAVSSSASFTTQASAGTVLYSNNFDAELNGALANWASVRGSAFSVSNINSNAGAPVQGTKHYGAGSDGDLVRWNGGAALDGQGIRIAQRYAASSSINIVTRQQNSSLEQCYRLGYSTSGGFIRAELLCRDNGTVAQVNGAYDIPVVAGDVVHSELRSVGNVHEARIWTNSNSRPSTPSATFTRSEHATGWPGLLKGGAFEFTACDQLVITNGLGGEDFFYAPDTTAPTLTSPTGTQTGANTANGSVSTNEANGTLYRLASLSASETGAAVKAANITQAVTATGVQNVSFTGLTQNTSYFAHYLHRDAAGNDSAVVTSASFTTAAGGDTTAPVLTGSITIGTVTSTSIQMSWPAGSDNVGIAGYDVSSNGGTSWTQLGNVLTHTFTSLSASTSYQLRVRARDAAGNLSTPVLSATQSTNAAATATLTHAFRNNTNSALANATIPHVTVTRLADRVQVLSLANQVTNGSGNLVINSASLVAATAYVTSCWNADGTSVGIESGTAV